MDKWNEKSNMLALFSLKVLTEESIKLSTADQK